MTAIQKEWQLFRRNDNNSDNNSEGMTMIKNWLIPVDFQKSVLSMETIWGNTVC